MFSFVLYVNPKAFSVSAHQQAIAERNRIEKVKEQQRQERVNLMNCVSRTYSKSGRTADDHLVTEKHRFKFQNNQCNEVIEVYYR